VAGSGLALGQDVEGEPANHPVADACARIVISAADSARAAYFLPTIIACAHDVPGKVWIFILNLFFGFSGIGYALAFVYAYGLSREELRRAAERERLSEKAHRAIVVMERRSREALAYRG
jgi:hypothetical protein